MRYAQIRTSDVANGMGIRTSLYLQGCSRRCKGCFNPETWNFNGGFPWTEEIEDKFLEMIGKPYIVGTSILGGEPLEPINRSKLLNLLRRIKKEYPHKNIWLYTSYLFEELQLESPEILLFVDVLIDGEFIEEKRDSHLRYRGSSNQRIINVPVSIKEGYVCLYK